MNSYYDILGYIGWAWDILIMITHSSERKIRTELMTENTWMECLWWKVWPSRLWLVWYKYGTSRYSSVGHGSSQASADISLDVWHSVGAWWVDWTCEKTLLSQFNKYYGQYIFNTFWALWCVKCVTCPNHQCPLMRCTKQFAHILMMHIC